MKKTAKGLLTLLGIGVSGFLVKPLEWLFGLIPFEKVFDKENWQWLTDTKYSLLEVVLFLIVLVILNYLFCLLRNRFLARRIVVNDDEIVDQCLEKVNEFIDENNKIRVTWEVYKGSLYDHDPHPMNIQCFCLRHDQYPLKFIGGHCPDPSCPNNRMHVGETQLRNQIESILLAKRDEMKEAIMREKE